MFRALVEEGGDRKEDGVRFSKVIEEEVVHVG